MIDQVETLRQTLRLQGQSITQPRQVVFNQLLYNEPQTMQQLVTRCAPQIDRASVYRTVKLFERLGIVERLQIGWKYKIELTDAFSHHHHHLTCLRCGSVQALPEDSLIEQQLEALARQRGFLAQAHQLELRGLCAQCQVA